MTCVDSNLSRAKPMKKEGSQVDAFKFLLSMTTHNFLLSNSILIILYLLGRVYHEADPTLILKINSNHKGRKTGNDSLFIWIFIYLITLVKLIFDDCWSVTILIKKYAPMFVIVTNAKLNFYIKYFSEF